MARGHWFLALALVAAACNGDDTDTGDDDDDDGTPNDTDTDTNGDDDDDQIPPQGYAAINAWLQAESYEDWHCEAAPHPGAGVSPHGMNQICSNDLASANTGSEFPVGAASVKELYDDAGTTTVGYAVTSKVSAGTGAETWYFYEQVPPGTVITGITIDANGVVADGLGDTGQAASVCASCHVTSGNDYVWVQVP
jgi:hypothetical protein